MPVIPLSDNPIPDNPFPNPEEPGHPPTFMSRRIREVTSAAGKRLVFSL